jgi:AmmeMemoRadiSam system protein B
VVLLRDSLGLVDRAVAVPTKVAPLLELCDGTRDIATLRTALELRTGVRIGPGYIENLLKELDEALLLENERFDQVYKDAVRMYKAAPHRLPSLAGAVYAADPESLARSFEEYFSAVPSESKDVKEVGQVRGMITPHIDYARGASIYAQVWQMAAEAVREADLAVILGTNHQDCHKLITLTRQNYYTPWGVLPTAGDVVDEVAAVLGEGEVFAEELHHRNEHSVEVAAVWLHYLAKDRNCELVPVLCGSFYRFIEGGEQPGSNEQLALFVDTLKRVTDNKRTLIIAAGDLSHVGPAFGDGYRIGPAEKASLSTSDTELMDTMAKGDSEGMFLQIKKEGDRRRVCGLPPIYLALRILGEPTGKITGYAQCPADQEEASFVSICGMIFD